MGISVTVFSLLYFRNMLSGRFSLLLMIGIPILLYYFFKYLSPELGPNFKIPKSKIEKVEIKNNHLEFHFQDANNTSCRQLIEKVKADDLNEIVSLCLNNSSDSGTI